MTTSFQVNNPCFKGVNLSQAFMSYILSAVGVTGKAAEKISSNPIVQQIAGQLLGSYIVNKS